MSALFSQQIGYVIIGILFCCGVACQKFNNLRKYLGRPTLFSEVTTNVVCIL